MAFTILTDINKIDDQVGVIRDLISRGINLRPNEPIVHVHSDGPDKDVISIISQLVPKVHYTKYDSFLFAAVVETAHLSPNRQKAILNRFWIVFNVLDNSQSQTHPGYLRLLPFDGDSIDDMQLGNGWFNFEEDTSELISINHLNYDTNLVIKSSEFPSVNFVNCYGLKCRQSYDMGEYTHCLGCNHHDTTAELYSGAALLPLKLIQVPSIEHIPEDKILKVFNKVYEFDLTYNSFKGDMCYRSNEVEWIEFLSIMERCPTSCDQDLLAFKQLLLKMQMRIQERDTLINAHCQTITQYSDEKKQLDKLIKHSQKEYETHCQQYSTKMQWDLQRTNRELNVIKTDLCHQIATLQEKLVLIEKQLVENKNSMTQEEIKHSTFIDKNIAIQTAIQRITQLDSNIDQLRSKIQQIHDMNE